MTWVFTKDKGKEFDEKLDNNPDFWGSSGGDIERDDEELIKVVKESGDKANGRYAKLRIVKIPSGIDWEIGNYDGMETVEEKHRNWS